MNKNDTTNSYVSLIFRMHHSKTSLTHTSNRKQLVHAHKIASNTIHGIHNPSVFNAFVKLKRNTQVPLYDI